jgi:hypothetical protein
MKRAAWSVVVVALAAAAALALWLRVTSLGAIPEFNADEAWYGVQANRLLAGAGCAAASPTGNPPNPFLWGMNLALHLAFAPAAWVLRVPAVACGLLAVVLAYVLGARVLDRATALMAAALLAVLPAAIMTSRLGMDGCQVQLAGVVALYFAFRANRAGLLLSVLAGLMVHVTTIFVLPALLGVYLARAARRPRPEGGPAPRRRWVASAAWAGALATGAGLLAFRLPNLGRYYRQFYQARGWWHCPAGFDRFFLMLGPLRPGPDLAPTPEATLWWYDRAFWGTTLGLLALGSWRLARWRQWDRLALVVGLLVGAAGFQSAAGPTVYDSFGSARYLTCLIAPLALALACLARALVIAPGGAWRGAARLAQAALAVSVLWGLLLTAKAHSFDAFGAQHHESPWTFRADAEDYLERVTALILRDLGGPRPGPPRVVIAQDWWTYWPLRYLAGERKDLRFVFLGEVGSDMGQRLRGVSNQLRAGGFAVGLIGGDVERTVRLVLTPERVRCRMASGIQVFQADDAPAPAAPGGRALPAPGDYDGDGKADFAAFWPDTGDWRAQLSGGGSLSCRFDVAGGEVPAPGDYDGDRKSDPAVFRPESSRWQIRQSSGGFRDETSSALPFGRPAPADYDGDGRADPAVFHPLAGVWTIAGSRQGVRVVARDEARGGLPAPGDYDGDGKADLVVFKPITAEWFLMPSRGAPRTIAFGQGTLYGGEPVAVPADYDGDGKADLALFQRTTADWFVWPSAGGVAGGTFGQGTTFGGDPIPAPADYDGDGRPDLAIFRPSRVQWQVRQKDGGTQLVAVAPPGPDAGARLARRPRPRDKGD